MTRPDSPVAASQHEYLAYGHRVPYANVSAKWKLEFAGIKLPCFVKTYGDATMGFNA